MSSRYGKIKNLYAYISHPWEFFYSSACVDSRFFAKWVCVKLLITTLISLMNPMCNYLFSSLCLFQCFLSHLLFSIYPLLLPLYIRTLCSYDHDKLKSTIFDRIMSGTYFSFICSSFPFSFFFLLLSNPCWLPRSLLI